MTSQCKSAPRKSAKIPPDYLIEKFSRYKALTPAERNFLSDLQSEERLAAPNQEVIVQGGRSDYLFVLKSGRAYSHKMLPDRSARRRVGKESVGTSRYRWGRE